MENNNQNTKRKRIIKNKIFGFVNYSKPNRNITSIKIKINNKEYSFFVNGIYIKKVEIEYHGKEFNTSNIISIKECD